MFKSSPPLVCWRREGAWGGGGGGGGTTGYLFSSYKQAVKFPQVYWLVHAECSNFILAAVSLTTTIHLEFQ